MAKIFIFGAGLAGKSALSYLNKNHEILGFIDNDPVLQSTCCHGHKIYSTDILKSSTFDYIYIASEFFEQIKSQLENKLKIQPEKIKTLAARNIKSFQLGIDERSLLRAEQVLHIVSEHLKRSSIINYVDAGTLLGIYRDNALIPWDDDLDFAVHENSVDRLISAFPDLLNELTQITGKKWQIKQLVAKQTFGAVKKGVIRSFKLFCIDSVVDVPSIDFFIKYIDGNRMDYVLASRGISMPSSYIEKRKYINFKGFNLIIPENTDSYLAGHYGEDWKIPKRDWDLSMLCNSKIFE